MLKAKSTPFSVIRDVPWIRRVVLIGCGLAIVQQATGINTVNYYAPTILEESGLGVSAALVATIAVGVTSVVTTIIGIILLGYIGRRTMLLIGFAGVAASQLALSLVFLMSESTLRSYVILGCMVLFVAFVQMFIGTCVWLLLSEIFPLSIRGFAMGIAVFVLWCTNAIISFLFPLLNSALGSTGTFLLFVAVNVGSWLFVRKFVPETKGTTLEELEERFEAAGRRGAETACAALTRLAIPRTQAAFEAECARASRTRTSSAASLPAVPSPDAQASMPTVPVNPMSRKRLRDRGVVDLAGARLAAAGHVGDLDLADGVPAAPDQLDEVPLADLRVVQVEHHLHVRMADAFDERQRVLRAGERHAGMVDDGVEVLDAERDARRRAELADPLERALRGQPHLAGGAVARPRRLAVDELGGVQVEPRNTKRLSGFDAQLGRPHHLVGAGAGRSGRRAGSRSSTRTGRRWRPGRRGPCRASSRSRPRSRGRRCGGRGR